MKAEDDYSNVEWSAQIIPDRNGQWTDHSRLEQASREQYRQARERQVLCAPESVVASGAAGAARDRFVAMASGPLWRTAALLLTRCGTQRTLQGLEDMCKGLQIVCPVPPTINSSWRHMHTTNRGMLGTTVLCVRKGANVVMIGDGQVTQGAEIIKPNVRKVRRLGANVIGGFAGATADSFTLFERLETKLEEHSGQLTRAAVELAKAWRSDKFLRRLDAVMVVADAEVSLTITGNGDVLEPYDGVIGIGSGGSYALAAARALLDLPDMDAETIARKAMKIAADCCIYTNHNFTIERIEAASSRSSEVVREAASMSASDSFVAAI